MNFDLSDEQRMLRDQARRFLESEAPTSAARAVLECDAPLDDTLWRKMAEMGWQGSAVPDVYGGAGLSYEELGVIAIELGRSLAPTPFSSSVYLATEALLLAGDQVQREHWLPQLAAGTAIGTLLSVECSGPFVPARLTATVRSGKLSGSKQMVPDGMSARLGVVLARDDDAKGDGLSLYLADLAHGGVARQAVSTVDPSRPHAAMDFDEVPAERLGAAGDGLALFETLRTRAAVLVACEQLGGTEACLDMARQYACERYAFGRPIGSYQAIKHKLADVYIKLELARAHVYYGLWALTNATADLHVASAAARVASTEAFNFAASENIQTHGGIGFTWEHDCHLYYRRSSLLSLTLGSPRVWKDKLVNGLQARNVA